jgi:anhydro-N-acetylmuramic acid kinase
MKWALGLMSGTSLDGIDIAAIRTDGHEIEEVGDGLTQPYTPALRQKLRSILGQKDYTPEIQAIEKEVTLEHVKLVERFLKEQGVEAKDIEIIGFHGHTIFHQSKRHQGIACTWQIGDGQLLANKVKIPVICNMRQADIQQGGEGAPMVPLYHQALAKELPKPLAVVNIGGVSNVTWLGENEEILAFDTGPGNALIDDWMMNQTGQDYDQDGKLASQGTMHPKILKQFLDHPYFKLSPPKSLDRHTFSLDGVNGLSAADGAATLTSMTGESIIKAQKFFPAPAKEWVLTGGGRHNQTLLAMLQKALAPAPVLPVEALGWKGDYLEAQAFAFLAVRSMHGLPLSVPSTTGVTQPVTGGELYKPENKVGK